MVEGGDVAGWEINKPFMQIWWVEIHVSWRSPSSHIWVITVGVGETVLLINPRVGGVK